MASTNLKKIKMENLKQITEILANKFSSLNNDYLTDKELDRGLEFLSDLSKKQDYYNSKTAFANYPELVVKNCDGLINGYKSYIDSLEIKISQRRNIPNWYAQNKI